MKSIVAAIFGITALGSLTSAAVAPLPVRTSSADEYFPSADHGALMWTQDPPHVSKPVVHLRLPGGILPRVNPKGTTAFSVGISGRHAVYLQLTPRVAGLSAFRLYDFVTHKRRVVRVTPKSGVGVSGAFGDELLLYETNTGGGREGIQLRNILTGRDILLDRVFSGWLRVGSVNRNFAVWKKCVVTDCGVYGYDIARHTTVQLPNPAGLDQSAPSVLPDGSVYVVEGKAQSCPTSEASLVRYRAGGTRTVLATFAPRVAVARTSATAVHGTPTVYFDRGACRPGGATRGFDIYKVADIPQPG
jgi:hypothetical protein